MEKCLPDTQSQEYTECSQIQDTQELIRNVKTPWGRLCTCNPNLTPVDLYDNSYTCGRDPNCSIVITNIPSLLNVSKEHFRIYLDDGIVFITDLSKNGTFVNSYKVGRNNKHILTNKDIIAIGQPSTKVFIFNCNVNPEECFLPQELRKTYFVSKLLGKGACGEVRYARNKQTCKEFAIKKIMKGRSSSNLCNLNHPQKIKTEIDILNTISHPFIIGMEQVYETETEVLMVLEYMKGGDLGNLIYSLTPLPKSQVKFIFYQMILAINFLHERGITHRDLKPENVLLSRIVYPIIKISDFGLSKVLTDLSVMQTLCGTINYVAPEILRHCESYTKKVDVWSLGVILYQMFSKTLPFYAAEREDVAKRILKGKFDFPGEVWKGVSGSAQDLIKKMLALNPKQRISVKAVLPMNSNFPILEALH